MDDYDQGPVARLAEIFSGGKYKSKKQKEAEERRAAKRGQAAEQEKQAAQKKPRKWPWQR